MDASPSSPQSLTIGISIEASSAVAAQMSNLSLQNQKQSQNSHGGIGSGSGQELVLAKSKPDTLLLAQRIIKNAFNFLASFSGNLEGGVEVVPLKAFEGWWGKFEARVRNDPGFLERDGD